MPFPIPLEKIAETEAAMGVIFPALFKARMNRDNGGELLFDEDESWWLFPFFDTTNRKTIARSCNDIRRETEQLRAAGLGFPADAVAIAHNGSGDHLFLRSNGTSELGREVWLFRHEGGEVSQLLDDVAELWNPHE